MRSKPLAITAVAVVAVVGILVWWFWWWSCTTVVLVRHAEREGPQPNANLTAAGLDRAQDLGAALASAGVAAVYSTEFCRTVQTAEPTALQAGLPVVIQEISGGNPGVGSCTPAIQVSTQSSTTQGAWDEELARRIRREHRGRLVLVVSHSNTTLDLLEELTGDSACPDIFPVDPQTGCVIPEEQFDNLFVVELPRFGLARWMHVRFGAASS